jgi:two-component system chemotaxis response regulator CheB
MGADGSNGLLHMKKAGSFNIAQDEKTSVVFGMPRVAIEKGAIDVVLPLQQIAERIIAECSKTEFSRSYY